MDHSADPRTPAATAASEAETAPKRPDVTGAEQAPKPTSAATPQAERAPESASAITPGAEQALPVRARTGPAERPNARTGAEQPWDPEDVAVAKGLDPTPRNVARARQQLAEEGRAVIERLVP